MDSGLLQGHGRLYKYFKMATAVLGNTYQNREIFPSLMLMEPSDLVKRRILSTHVVLSLL